MLMKVEEFGKVFKEQDIFCGSPQSQQSSQNENILNIQHIHTFKNQEVMSSKKTIDMSPIVEARISERDYLKTCQVLKEDSKQLQQSKPLLLRITSKNSSEHFEICTCNQWLFQDYQNFVSGESVVESKQYFYEINRFLGLLDYTFSLPNHSDIFISLKELKKSFMIFNFQQFTESKIWDNFELKFDHLKNNQDKQNLQILEIINKYLADISFVKPETYDNTLLLELKDAIKGLHKGFMSCKSTGRQLYNSKKQEQQDWVKTTTLNYILKKLIKVFQNDPNQKPKVQNIQNKQIELVPDYKTEKTKQNSKHDSSILSQDVFQSGTFQRNMIIPTECSDHFSKFIHMGELTLQNSKTSPSPSQVRELNLSLVEPIKYRNINTCGEQKSSILDLTWRRKNKQSLETIETQDSRLNKDDDQMNIFKNDKLTIRPKTTFLKRGGVQKDDGGIKIIQQIKVFQNGTQFDNKLNSYNFQMQRKYNANDGTQSMLSNKKVQKNDNKLKIKLLREKNKSVEENKQRKVNRQTIPEILNLNKEINSLHKKMFTKKEANLFGAINQLFVNNKASTLVSQKTKEISSKTPTMLQSTLKIIDHEIPLTAVSKEISRSKQQLFENQISRNEQKPNQQTSLSETIKHGLLSINSRQSVKSATHIHLFGDFSSKELLSQIPSQSHSQPVTSQITSQQTQIRHKEIQKSNDFENICINNDTGVRVQLNSKLGFLREEGNNQLERLLENVRASVGNKIDLNQFDVEIIKSSPQIDFLKFLSGDYIENKNLDLVFKTQNSLPDERSQQEKSEVKSVKRHTVSVSHSKFPSYNIKDEEIDEEPFFLRTPVNMLEQSKIKADSKDLKQKNSSLNLQKSGQGSVRSRFTRQTGRKSFNKSKQDLPKQDSTVSQEEKQVTVEFPILIKKETQDMHIQTVQPLTNQQITDQDYKTVTSTDEMIPTFKGERPTSVQIFQMNQQQKTCPRAKLKDYLVYQESQPRNVERLVHKSRVPVNGTCSPFSTIARKHFSGDKASFKKTLNERDKLIFPDKQVMHKLAVQSAIHSDKVSEDYQQQSKLQSIWPHQRKASFAIKESLVDHKVHTAPVHIHVHSVPNERTLIEYASNKINQRQTVSEILNQKNAIKIIKAIDANFMNQTIFDKFGKTMAEREGIRNTEKLMKDYNAKIKLAYREAAYFFKQDLINLPSKDSTDPQLSEVGNYIRKKVKALDMDGLKGLQFPIQFPISNETEISQRNLLTDMKPINDSLASLKEQRPSSKYMKRGNRASRPQSQSKVRLKKQGLKVEIKYKEDNDWINQRQSLVNDEELSGVTNSVSPFKINITNSVSPFKNKNHH